jgi:hypothetical protein
MLRKYSGRLREIKNLRTNGAIVLFILEHLGLHLSCLLDEIIPDLKTTQFAA